MAYSFPYQIATVCNVEHGYLVFITNNDYDGLRYHSHLMEAYNALGRDRYFREKLWVPKC